jgi:hypothetical protein
VVMRREAGPGAKLSAASQVLAQAPTFFPEPLPAGTLLPTNENSCRRGIENLSCK